MNKDILGIYGVVFVVFALTFFCNGRANAETSFEFNYLKPGAVIYVGIDNASSEWPPYEFFIRENGEKTGKMVGYSIDVLDEIFSAYGISYEFRAYPWKRTLANLVTGEKVQMILPTSTNADREKKYLMSSRVYSITPSFFYMRTKYPDGITISNAGDLLKYGEVCGRLGFNYANFGMENKNIETQADNFGALMKMLKTGRCDTVLARYEVLAGYALLGQPLLSNDIGTAPVPGVASEGFYYAVTRNQPFSNELLAVINLGLARLENQGRLAQIFAKYSK